MVSLIILQFLTFSDRKDNEELFLPPFLTFIILYTIYCIFFMVHGANVVRHCSLLYILIPRRQTFQKSFSYSVDIGCFLTHLQPTPCYCLLNYVKLSYQSLKHEKANFKFCL